MNDYEFYKEKGICVYCHKQKAKPGKCYCQDCLEHVRKWRDKHRDQWNRKNRERYASRKKMGLCVKCGKKAEKGIYCADCHYWMNTKRRLLRYLRKKDKSATTKNFIENSMSGIIIQLSKEL